MTRCIYTDPRPGDRVQVIPDVCERLPEPMTIIAVSRAGVHWRRPIVGQERCTPWSHWQSEGMFGCRRRLELVEAVPMRQEDQIDMFGEVSA
ncbi:hypothetical protein V6R97_08735 [Chromohalobacter salexigens]|uniref:hypothetical protein n=1 Tax=Chromohalobacter israelensis TaxID=141390 RepID=UPI0032E903DE